MNTKIMRLMLLFIVASAFIPELSFGLDLNWKNPAEDKSVYFLSQIFGPMSTALEGTGDNGLIGSLFNIFNIAVLTLGSLVVSYTIVLSTINTAQEGEVMGKKWSSMWIPFRSALGIAFLLPTASGYSLIQIMLMNIIVLGIAAGNQLWQTVLNSMESGTGVFGAVKFTGDVDIPNVGPINPLFDVVSSGILRGMVCAQVFNSDPTCKAAILNLPVSSYVSGSSYVIGVEGNSKYANLCGKVTGGSQPANAYSADTWKGSNLSAAGYAASNLAQPASEIFATGTESSWTGVDVIKSATNTMRGTLAASPLLKSETHGYYIQQAIQNGWMYAGSYYFTVISEENNNSKITFPVPTFTPGTYTDASTGISNSCVAHVSTYLERAEKYIAATNLSSQVPATAKLQLAQPSISSSTASQFYQVLAGPINTAAYNLMDAVTTNMSDPIASLHRVGSDIMVVAESVWLAMLAFSFFSMLIACVTSGMTPTCWAVGAILTVLTPILTIIISLLWGVGAMMGIYLPVIPYLVFTFTALGWLLLVIEAIAAAPIIALGLVSPSQENMGKASGSVLLITNVFLRPS